MFVCVRLPVFANVLYGPVVPQFFDVECGVQNPFDFFIGNEDGVVLFYTRCSD